MADQKQQPQPPKKPPAEAPSAVASQDALVSQPAPEFRPRGPTIVDAPPNRDVPPIPRGEWDEYLRGNGWERLATNEAGIGIWADPEHRDAKESQRVINLPNKDGEIGGPIIVRQMILPPLQWDYPTEQAMLIQRQRDKVAEKTAAA